MCWHPLAAVFFVAIEGSRKGEKHIYKGILDLYKGHIFDIICWLDNKFREEVKNEI